MSPVARLLIVDGHAYAYRAFHAIRGLRSPSGMADECHLRLRQDAGERCARPLAPTHLIVVWDGGLSAERMALLPEYKAQRPEMPDDLRPQLDGMVDYLKAAGVASFCRDGRRGGRLHCVSRAARGGRGHDGGHRQRGQGFYAVGVGAGRIAEPGRQERERSGRTNRCARRPAWRRRKSWTGWP